MSGTVTLDDTTKEKWIWTSIGEKSVVTQNAWMGMYNGFERQN